MSGDLYRDAHVGLRARIAELEVRIGEREAEVTRAFWDMLPKEAREELASLREGNELAGADTLDELSRAESMLATYLERLEALIGGLPSVEAEWSELPDDVEAPPPPTMPWATRLFHAALPRDVQRPFELVVRDRDRAATFETDGAATCVARFRERGCPFALRASLGTDRNGQSGEIEMWLVTSIPRGLPPLVVRHESLVLTVGKALGIRHEVEVGDPSFDGLFLIEGTKEAAELYLLPSLRAQLLALSRFDVPTLTIDPARRVASLEWRFEPAQKALDAALRVLVAVRETPLSLEFLSADGRSRR